MLVNHYNEYLPEIINLHKIKNVCRKDTFVMQYNAEMMIRKFYLKMVFSNFIIMIDVNKFSLKTVI